MGGSRFFGYLLIATLQLQLWTTGLCSNRDLQLKDFPSDDELSSFSAKAFDGSMPKCEYMGSALNVSKICRYRETYYRELIFYWRASHGCYFYTQPALLRPDTKPPSITLCTTPLGNAPCVILPKRSGEMGCYPLDETIPETMAVLRQVMVSEKAVQRWQRCTMAARSCCDRTEVAILQPGNETCPAVWDAWDCWMPGSLGEDSEQVCSEFAYSNSGPACHHYSSKTCFGNATWKAQTDYTGCSVTPRLVTRAWFHVACLGVSLCVGVPAVLVLASYRRLRARSLALHRNLLTVILLRNLLIIITKSVIIIDELTSSSGDTAMSRNGATCRALATMEKMAASATFAAMLMDGAFLHRRIAAPFKREYNIKLAYCIAIVSTMVPVIIWASLMSTMNDSNCWLVYTVSGLQWTLDAPRLLMLILNTGLLLDILRVLLTKLRRNDNPNQLNTTKATLFLMPLFGVQFLLTAVRPNTTSCSWEQTYYFLTYIMDGLQAIMVSIFYCYWNKEVHCLLKMTYKKTETVVSARFRRENRGRRATQGEIASRRDTFTTTVMAHRPSDFHEKPNRLFSKNNPESNRIMPNFFDEENNDDDTTMIDAILAGTHNSQVTSRDHATVNNAFCADVDEYVKICFEYDVAEAFPPAELNIQGHKKVRQRTLSVQESLKNNSKLFPNDSPLGNKTPRRASMATFNIPSYSISKDLRRDSDSKKLSNNNKELDIFLQLKIKDPIKHAESLAETISIGSSVDPDYTKRPTLEMDEVNLNECSNTSVAVKENNIPAIKVNDAVIISDLFDINDNHLSVKQDDNNIDRLTQGFYDPKKDNTSNNEYSLKPDDGGNGRLSDFSLTSDIIRDITAFGINAEEVDQVLSDDAESGDASDKESISVVIDPAKLCPNRPIGEKIIFINE